MPLNRSHHVTFISEITKLSKWLALLIRIWNGQARSPTNLAVYYACIQSPTKLSDLYTEM